VAVTRLTYGFGRQVDAPFDEVLARAKAALQAEGFGLMCEIDVRKTIKEKLGAEFRRYVILGACNPPLAHRALEAEPDLGLLLPCNVIVYEADGGATVEAIDPEKLLGLVHNPELEPVAREVKARFERAIERLAEG